MPCYQPNQAWLLPGAKGKKKVIFGSRDSSKVPYYDTRVNVDLPCGQCIGCRLERSRRWAVRIMHETQMHQANSFLTLTYSDEYVPKDGSLKVEDFQKFFKRLRRGRGSGSLRFYHCGEYGEENSRPHYHVCLFGEDFISDRFSIEDTQSGHPQWMSPTLDKAWEMGRATIGELTFESAAYVARYCVKKITGDKADAHYGGRKPEYATMSRRPGIGASWLLKGKHLYETYRDDSVVMRGREMMPPPFYDKLLEKADPVKFLEIKRCRGQSSDPDHPDLRSRRLLDRRLCKEQTVKQCLKRKV